MMPRITIFALALFAIGAYAPLNIARAQVCAPQCAPGQTCVFKGSTDATQCIAAIQNGTVNELVVTAPAPASSGLSFKDLVETKLIPIGNQVITLLYAVAFVAFLYGMFRFFFTEGAAGREKGKQFMIYGVIGLAVLFSVWGLVNIFLTTITRLQ